MPYFAYLQPYSTWVALIFLTMVVTCYGYTVLLPGRFAIDTFFRRPMIDAYEAAYDKPAVGFCTEIGQMFGFRRNKKLPEI
jgi:amino acid transporter